MEIKIRGLLQIKTMLQKITLVCREKGFVRLNFRTELHGLNPKKRNTTCKMQFSDYVS